MNDFDRLQTRCAKTEALLCAILRSTTLGALDVMIRDINWKRAGVMPDDLLNFWREHLALDERRTTNRPTKIQR